MLYNKSFCIHLKSLIELKSIPIVSVSLSRQGKSPREIIRLGPY